MESFDNTYHGKILENFCQNFDKYKIWSVNEIWLFCRPEVIEIQINF